MARKRDIVEEILGKRTRLGRRRDPASRVESRTMGLFLAIYNLERMPKADREMKRELIRYVSVGLVSCIEGYFRQTIQHLVDQGSPYRERASRLDEVRVDLGTITRLYSQRVGVGELISHLIPLSSLDDVNRHMSALLAVDFFAALKPMVLWDNHTFGERHPNAWEALAGTFADRHIACHELDPRTKWTFRRATDQWRVTIHLIDATEALLQSIGVKPR